MFECDAKLSADGVVFLMHDATLERTTTGQGIGGDQPVGRTGAAGRRQLAFTRPCGRAPAHAGKPSALLHRQRLTT
jgi:glycerophosphoryl diester phosphodiesterase